MPVPEVNYVYRFYDEKDRLLYVGMTRNPENADRGQGLPQSRPLPLPAGQSVIDVDPVFGNPQTRKSFPLEIRSCW